MLASVILSEVAVTIRMEKVDARARTGPLWLHTSRPPTPFGWECPSISQRGPRPEMGFSVAARRLRPRGRLAVPPRPRPLKGKWYHQQQPHVI